VNDKNRAGRVTNDALGGTAQGEMFEPGISARCHNDQIDLELTSKPADLLEWPASNDVDILGTRPDRLAFELVQARSDALIHTANWHDERNSMDIPKRRVRLDYMNEVQSGAEAFDQR
jgi:hypothetical protein